MADNVTGKKISALPAVTTAADTDVLIIESAAPKTNKITFLNLFNAVKKKLGLKTIATSGKASDVSFAPPEGMAATTVQAALTEQNSNIAVSGFTVTAVSNCVIDDYTMIRRAGIIFLWVQMHPSTTMSSSSVSTMTAKISAHHPAIRVKGVGYSGIFGQIAELDMNGNISIRVIGSNGTMATSNGFALTFTYPEA